MGVRDRESINIWVECISPDVALLILTVAVGPRKPFKKKKKLKYLGPKITDDFHGHQDCLEILIFFSQMNSEIKEMSHTQYLLPCVLSIAM